MLRCPSNALGYAQHVAPTSTTTAERPLRALVDRHRNEILATATRHGGTRVRLFGSVARGDETPDSDIDFLVDFTSGTSLFDLVGLIDDLRALLHVSVDVVSTGGLLERDDDVRAEAQDL
jgi:predicted nucleotidyltransferase